jgi:hypothetical protein
VRYSCCLYPKYLMTRTSVDDTTFTQIVAASRSIRQVIQKMGLVPAGGNYTCTEKRIVRLGLDTTHLLGQGHNKGKHTPRRPLVEYLLNIHPIHSHELRKRLIKEGVFEAKCNNCGNTEWMGGPIPLELDHIDGHHMNNVLHNLQLLCPNCHALTPSYRGKNKGHSRSYRPAEFNCVITNADGKIVASRTGG